ncbi:hypothetical protein evm_009557 [Chilo suppressalis]|nr:hypothetical protein evm_009557 [Chilo suppressalis]
MTTGTSMVPEKTKTTDDSEEILDVALRVSANGMRLGSLLRTWTEVSRINYMSSQPLDVITSAIHVEGDNIRRRTIGIPMNVYS